MYAVDKVYNVYNVYTMDPYTEPSEKQLDAYFNSLRPAVAKKRELLKRHIFMLPPSLVRELQRQAHNQCMSGSQLLRNILTKHLE